jgi:UDP-glucose 4-epimerase
MEIVKRKIIVTGGCGYIGSHTIFQLVREGYEIISIDDNSRSNLINLSNISNFFRKEIVNHKINICEINELDEVISKYNNIEAIINFAAFKSVSESENNPLLYYHNNINSVINICNIAIKYNIKKIIFSSSCTVYGDSLYPVDELHSILQPKSIYGMTKKIGEDILLNISQKFGIKVAILRYFNPVGADSSGIIGEIHHESTTNLFPKICKYIYDKEGYIYIYGNNYDSNDGTCIRDYIDIEDIASGHILALNYLNSISDKVKDYNKIFNLGSNEYYTVLEIIQIFEKITKEKIEYKIMPRRIGDVFKITCSNLLAKSILNWKPQFDIYKSVQTALKWNQKYNGY